MTIGVKSFVTPTSNVQPELLGNNFIGNFSNTAEFSHASGESCAPGVYRQYMRGKYKAGGSIVTHYLCEPEGRKLSETTYGEDGCLPPRCTAYGHRACAGVWNNKYTPDQASGCRYEMNDRPGFYNVSKGVTYELKLDFKGELKNVVDDTILETRLWTVHGQVTVPAVEREAAVAGLQTGDEIIGLYIARNEDSGAAEAHVIITRRAGSPPLDLAALSMTLKDAGGKPVVAASPPGIYEVGDGRGVTATIVVTLASASHVPVTAELGLRETTKVLTVGVR